MSEYKRFVVDDTSYETYLTQKFEKRKAYVAPDPRRVDAAIPGVIEEVQVRRGQKVRRGESLLVLEAMKMKNDVVAPRDGVILDVRVARGQMVTRGQLLVELE